MIDWQLIATLEIQEAIVRHAGSIATDAISKAFEKARDVAACICHWDRPDTRLHFLDCPQRRTIKPMETEMKLSKDARALLDRIVKADGRLMTQQLGDDSFAIAKKLAKAGYIKPGKHPTVLTGDRSEGVETLVATDDGRAALGV